MIWTKYKSYDIGTQYETDKIFGGDAFRGHTRSHSEHDG